MRVLVFVNYFSPAYKAGGPLKSLQGLVDYLGEELEFSIITSDRDVGDNESFPDIKTRGWTEQGNARVFYTDRITWTSLSQILKEESWDLLYLQSCFNPVFTLKPLLWWKLGLLKARGVLVASRGEFSPGAIRLKSAKKRAFLSLAWCLGLYRGVYFQASSEREKKDILREIPRLVPPARILTASNIPPKPTPCAQPERQNTSLNQGRLRVLHLSRITRMKNLEFALQVLSKVPFPIEFNIYGPLGDDPEYWQRCTRLMESLPDKIEVNYHGPISPNQVPFQFASHDVFFLPTRGENFGHAIFESLQSGCSVLLSDQTPWQDFQKKQVGWVLPLDNARGFCQALIDLNAESQKERNRRRLQCISYAEQFLLNGGIIKQNRQMFNDVQKQLISGKS